MSSKCDIERQICLNIHALFTSREGDIAGLSKNFWYARMDAETTPNSPSPATPPPHRETQIDLCSTRLESIFKELIRAARDGDNVAVLKLTDESKPLLAQLRSLYSDEAVKRYVLATTSAGFHKTLYREAQSKGLTISGENLRYTVADMQLKVDPENLAIDLSGKVHKTLRVPTILKLVEQRLAKTTKRVKKTTFTPTELLAKLHQGYLKHVQRPGEEVPLKKIYQEIIAEVGGNLRYMNADFQEDLSALFQQETLSFKGMKLEHAPSKDVEMNYRVTNRYGREVQIGSIRFIGEGNHAGE